MTIEEMVKELRIHLLRFQSYKLWYTVMEK